MNGAAFEKLLLPLARLRLRARAYRALDGGLRVVLAAVAAGAIQMALDSWLRLSLDQRAVVNLMISLGLVVVTLRELLLPLARPLSNQRLATEVDRLYPELHGQLATAVQFAAGEVGAASANSPQLVAATVSEMMSALPDVTFLSALDHRRARRRLAELGGIAAIVAAAWLIMPSVVSTWFQRSWLLRDIPWPQRTHIVPEEFVNGERRLPRGDEFELLARIIGRVPPAATLEWWTESGRRGETEMEFVGQDQVRARLGAITEELRFRVIGGDERTADFRVRVVERPAVLKTAVRIEPPEYTGSPPVVLEQQTVIEALRGSRLVIDATLNKPVTHAVLTGVNGPVGTLERESPDKIRLTWESPTSGSYAFELRDADGIESVRPVRLTLKITPDAPPALKLELTGVGELVTSEAALPARLSASDAYGLAAVRLMLQKNDEPPHAPVSEKFERGRREFLLERELLLASFEPHPGDTLKIWAEAGDHDPAGPNVGASTPVTLKVVSSTDLLAALAEREIELRREFERVISSQRGINDALQRLSAGLSEGGPPPPAIAQRLGGQARQEDAAAGRCVVLQRSFAQVLAEMRVNRVAKSADERRLLDRISEPLGRLATGPMSVVTGALGQIRRGVVRTDVVQLGAALDETLATMQKILANMLELEGYREAVAALESLLQDQRQLQTDTAAALDHQVEDILGEDEPKKP